jgi:hypothetical protein
MTPLDAWLPAYEFSEHHTRLVVAPESEVRRALHEVDVSRIPLLRVLMALRALPTLLFTSRAALARLREPQAPRTLGLMAVRGGALLCDEPREIVIGLTGRFWRATGEILPTDVAAFRDAPPAGAARVAMNFLLTPQPGGAMLVSAETRVHCADGAS